jgi:zinc protease
MEALTRQDALDWYRTYYAPNDAVLVVAGDVAPDAVKALAEKYYGPLEPTSGIGPRNRPQEPAQLAERRMSYRDARVAQPYITRSYLAPERDPGDQKKAAALTILAAALGGSAQTSIMAKALQFDSKIALYTSAGYDGTSYDDTTFNLALVPAPGVSMADAEKAMDGVLADVIKNGVDAEQFERIKTQIRADNIYAEDSVMGLAQRYGEALTTGLTIKDVEEWPAALDAVTVEDVKSVAAEVLDKRSAVTGWMMPESAGDDTTELLQ